MRYVRGQLERGSNTDYLHWQLLVVFTKPVRLETVRRTFGDVHAEPSRSSAATEYVWKDDTAIDGTRFEIGKLPFKRSSPRDWDAIWDLARSGQLEAIDRSALVPYYRTLRTIAADFAKPAFRSVTARVYWGRTGSGKSHRAWTEAGDDAYSKDPRTKFWDGYQGQTHVIFDEFRGAIDVGHLLRWLDKYPVNVEIKGSSTPLKATDFWFTSNIDPRKWYPDLDEETLNALLRRINIIHFDML